MIIFGERGNYRRLWGDKLIVGGVIAGWTFGSLGDTESVIAGSRECYRRLASGEYEGSGFLGQAKSCTNFAAKALTCFEDTRRIGSVTLRRCGTAGREDSTPGKRQRVALKWPWKRAAVFAGRLRDTGTESVAYDRPGEFLFFAESGNCKGRSHGTG